MEATEGDAEGPTQVLLAPTTSDATQGGFSVAHSVLDAQLEALTLGVGAGSFVFNLSKDTENSTTLEPGAMENLSLDVGDQIFAVFKSKGPNSLLGTGSSTASASDHSEVSDFESDSGIESSHIEVLSLKTGASTSILKKKKGVKLQPKDPLVSGVTKGDCNVEEKQADQCGHSEELMSCNIRIDSLIRCLDHKVSVTYCGSLD